MKKSICFSLFVLLLKVSFIPVHAQFIINEIFITNGSKDLNTTTYNFNDWIEIYNNSGVSLNASNFFLSNDSSYLNKWRLPASVVTAGSYRVYFLSNLSTGNFTNFRADADKGILYLSNNSGVIIDKIAYPKQFYNISYGRYPDATGSFHYLLNPSRGKDNNNNNAVVYKSPTVEFSTNGGFYNGSITLKLFNSLGLGNIYYTTNGAEPDTNSFIYRSTITLDTTTIIRARIIEKNKIPGDIVSHTFFVNQRIPDMKVVSLITDPKNFFDNKIGIYVEGTNGISLYCYGNANWNQDWERSVNFELFDNSHLQVVNQLTGVRIAGGCSRTNPQKSLVCYARSKYGNGKLDYKIFTNRECKSFNSILLRTAGNDFNNSMIRDVVHQKLADRYMNLEHQASEPSAIFINGAYYGIQYIYERSGDDLVEASFGLNEEEQDMGEGPGDLLLGTTSDYKTMLNFINTRSLAIQANYDKIASQIDIDDYIEYLIFQIYIGNNDWPGNNCKFWRMHEPKSKWRWILYDTDFGSGLTSGVNTNVLELMFSDDINIGWPNPEWSTRLFRKLIENPEFKRKFLSRFYAHINTSFKPELVIKTIDSVANLVKPEMSYHFKRWKTSFSSWNGNVQVLRNFANQRPDIVRAQLRALMGTGNDISVECHSVTSAYGYLSVDNVISKDTAYKGIFPQGSKSNISFIPAPGYVFKKVVKDNTSKQYFVTKSDLWEYYDGDPNISNDWKTDKTNASGWNTALAQFGYGENDENTVISYGNDANNKYITSYYRKNFYYNTSQNCTGFHLNILVDDGAVVYLNGKELLRHNIAQGVSVNYATLATNADPENVWATYQVDSSLLVDGINTIAVEVHQSGATSSDVSFDLEFFATTNNGKTIYDNSITETFNQDLKYFVYFEKAPAVTNLVINEVAPRNSAYADEYMQYDDWFEIYNAGPDSAILSNLFISDSMEYPCKFKIPYIGDAPITLAPNEYTVFWADGQIKQGPFHTNFKLNAEKEVLGLYQKIGEEINTVDIVNFQFFGAFQSYGRYPNATGTFKKLYKSTPLAENVDYTNINTEQSEHNGIKPIASYLPSSKTIRIQFNKDSQFEGTSVKVVDLYGRLMLSQTVQNANEYINANSLKPGMYMVVFNNFSRNDGLKVVVY